MLPGLSGGVEGTLYLHSSERAVGKQSAVFAGERYPLCYALVDDATRHLRQAIYVRFPRAVIAALYGVVEKSVDGIAVVLVILGGVDTPLSRDGVGPAGRILKAERLDLVAHLSQRCRRRSASQARANNDHFDPTLVGRVDQRHGRFVLGPLVFQWASGDFRIQLG